MKRSEIMTTYMMKKTSNIIHHKRRKYQRIAISEEMESNEKVILHRQIKKTSKQTPDGYERKQSWCQHDLNSLRISSD
jgi:hypothetical protein